MTYILLYMIEPFDYAVEREYIASAMKQDMTCELVRLPEEPPLRTLDC
jgi:hypothetical protein